MEKLEFKKTGYLEGLTEKEAKVLNSLLKEAESIMLLSGKVDSQSFVFPMIRRTWSLLKTKGHEEKLNIKNFISVLFDENFQLKGYVGHSDVEYPERKVFEYIENLGV